MPRPKVKPEDRQRSARACVPCKASKIRCDGAVPCGPCSKRDRIAACSYLEPSRKRLKSASTTPLGNQDEISQLHQPEPGAQTRARHVVAAGQDTATAANGSVAGGGSGTASSNPAREVSRLTQSRMLLSSKGEKLYVGESASLSFLQFLRQMLKTYMGPSAFTENLLKDSMLEVDAMHDDSPVFTDQSRAEKLLLIRMFRQTSSGILHLYTVEEITDLLDQHDALSPGNLIDGTGKHTRADQAALNMMLAIGCQCRGKKPVDYFNAARSFTCAQKLAFEGLLCDPSLDMVRVFLLMALYLAQACHRNASYMYLGIASRAACALGLHRKEQYQGLPEKERLMRWRTWKSLLILDTITSALLGRPVSIPTTRPDDAITHCDGDSDEMSELDRPQWLASEASFTICSHVLELQQSLGSDSNLDIATAEKFLGRLRQWNEALPGELRHFGHSTDDPLGQPQRELLMGATHVSCVYYFTTILVTRPFLISHLMSTIAQRCTTDRNGQATRQFADQPKVADLAQACLDAALYLANTGYMAVNSSLLSSNMCLLKAWMFAAGLVLAFSMFIDASEPVSSIDDAYRNAIAVLERLAEASPQARHYFDILTALSEAIHARREQLASERRRKSGRYVSQIFTTDLLSAALGARPEAAAMSGSSGNGIGEGPGDLQSYDIDPIGYDLFDLSQQIDAWANIPLQSDNLYFDWEDGDGWMKNLV